MARKIKPDDPQRVVEQIKLRFRHLDDQDAFTRALMEEALRRHLGQERPKS